MGRRNKCCGQSRGLSSSSSSSSTSNMRVTVRHQRRAQLPPQSGQLPHLPTRQMQRPSRHFSGTARGHAPGNDQDPAPRSQPCSKQPCAYAACGAEPPTGHKSVRVELNRSHGLTPLNRHLCRYGGSQSAPSSPRGSDGPGSASRTTATMAGASVSASASGALRGIAGGDTPGEVCSSFLRRSTGAGGSGAAAGPAAELGLAAGRESGGAEAGQVASQHSARAGHEEQQHPSKNEASAAQPAQRSHQEGRGEEGRKEVMPEPLADGLGVCPKGLGASGPAGEQHDQQQEHAQQQQQQRPKRETADAAGRGSLDLPAAPQGGVGGWLSPASAWLQAAATAAATAGIACVPVTYLQPDAPPPGGNAGGGGGGGAARGAMRPPSVAEMALSPTGLGPQGRPRPAVSPAPGRRSCGAQATDAAQAATPHRSDACTPRHQQQARQPQEAPRQQPPATAAARRAILSPRAPPPAGAAQALTPTKATCMGVRLTRAQLLQQEQRRAAAARAGRGSPAAQPGSDSPAAAAKTPRRLNMPGATGPAQLRCGAATGAGLGAQPDGNGQGRAGAVGPIQLSRGLAGSRPAVVPRLQLSAVIGAQEASAPEAAQPPVCIERDAADAGRPEAEEPLGDAPNTGGPSGEVTPAAGDALG
jgi:hypothetical protein